MKTQPSPAVVFAEENSAPKTQITLAFCVIDLREMTAGAPGLVTGNPNWHSKDTVGGKRRLCCCHYRNILKQDEPLNSKWFNQLLELRKYFHQKICQPIHNG